MKKTFLIIQLIKYYFLSKIFIILTFFRGNKRVCIEKKAFLPLSSTISSETYIGYATGITGKITIKGTAKATIGKYCAIGDNVKIITDNHNMNTANLHVTMAQNYFNFALMDKSKGDVKIGSNVWIGDSVIILPGVSIGDGAIIGAGSIVTKSVPPFGIYAGNPAQLIRYRFSQNIIKQLLRIKWWDWNKSKIEKNKKFFTIDLVDNSDVKLENVII